MNSSSANHHQHHAAAIGAAGIDADASVDMDSEDGNEAQDRDTPNLLSKKPCNFMTQDVIEATIQCVVAQADECQKSNVDAKTSERMILEEFGRCLVEIIEFSLKNTEN